MGFTVLLFQLLIGVHSIGSCCWQREEGIRNIPRVQDQINTIHWTPFEMCSSFSSVRALANWFQASISYINNSMTNEERISFNLLAFRCLMLSKAEKQTQFPNGKELVKISARKLRSFVLCAAAIFPVNCVEFNYGKISSFEWQPFVDYELDRANLLTHNWLHNDLPQHYGPLRANECEVPDRVDGDPYSTALTGIASTSSTPAHSSPIHNQHISAIAFNAQPQIF